MINWARIFFAGTKTGSRHVLAAGLSFASLATILMAAAVLMTTACYSDATTPAILRGPRPGPTYCDPQPNGYREPCPNGWECVNRLCEAPNHIDVPYSGLARDGGT